MPQVYDSSLWTGRAPKPQTFAFYVTYRMVPPPPVYICFADNEV